MITNASCTVFRVDREGDCSRLFFPVVMWQGKRGVSVNAHGEETEDRTVIFIPDVKADIIPGDYVCRGNIPEFSEENALRIMSVKCCDYGSADMQHIRLEAV